MLNRAAILWLAMSRLPHPCAAQFRPCQFSQVSPPKLNEGVAVSRISWVEPGGDVRASVFVPDSGDLLPGIVFPTPRFTVRPRAPIWWDLRGR